MNEVAGQWSCRSDQRTAAASKVISLASVPKSALRWAASDVEEVCETMPSAGQGIAEDQPEDGRRGSSQMASQRSRLNGSLRCMQSMPNNSNKSLWIPEVLLC